MAQNGGSLEIVVSEVEYGSLSVNQILMSLLEQFGTELLCQEKSSERMARRRDCNEGQA